MKHFKFSCSFFAVLFILFSISSQAATYTFTGASGGSWGTTANWTAVPAAPGTLPGASDSVVIPDAKNVTVDVSPSITSLTFGSGGNATTITLNSGVTLTCSNVINFLQVTGTIAHTIAVGSANLRCKTLIMANNNGNSRVSSITISTGKLTVDRDISFSGSRTVENQIVLSGAGSVVIGGNFNPSFYTFTLPSGSKVIFNGSTAQTIASGFVFSDLQFYGAGTKTFSGTALTKVGLNTTDSMDIRAGTTVDFGTMLLEAGSTSVDFYIAGTLQTANTVGLFGSLTTTLKSTNSPVITYASGSVIEYNSTLAQAVTTSTAYQGLKITGASTKTISGTTTLAQNLEIGASAILAYNAATLTVTGNIIGTGSLTSTSGTLNIAGDFSNSGTFTCGTGTVNYNKSGAQNIKATTYNILTISGSGTKSLLGNAIVGSTMNLTAGNLSIGSNTLTLNGALGTTTGKFIGSATSNLIINGTGSFGTLSFDNTSRANRSLYDFTLNRNTAGAVTLNSAATADTLVIINSLTVSAGTLTTGGRLLLASSSTQTARVAPLVGSISGNVMVERYIPGGSNKRKWRFMASPVNAGGGNNNITLAQFKDDIFVTAPNGAAGSFDVSNTNQASIRTYNEAVAGSSLNGWTDPTDITNTIATGQGVEVFVRGSRNLANPYLNWTVPDNVVIDFYGNLNSGNVTVNLSYTNSGNTNADGMNLVGNPYASPINFDTTVNFWTKTNMDNKFWCYNPNTTLYGIYDADLQTGTNGITKYIASSQAFFVHATATGASLTFTENVKCISPGNQYFRPAQTSQGNLNSQLAVKLRVDSATTGDEILFVIDPNGTYFGDDVHDAGKFYNDKLNLFTKTIDNKYLAISAIPTPGKSDTVDLLVYSYDTSNVRHAEHHLDFNKFESIDPAIHLFLYDSYSDSLIDIRLNNTYDFTINGDSTSFGADRFKLIFNNTNVGIDQNRNELKVYPNPSTNYLIIRDDKMKVNETVNLEVVDMMGRTIFNSYYPFNNGSIQLNTSEIPSGNYILKVKSAEQVKWTKFIKE